MVVVVERMPGSAAMRSVTTWAMSSWVLTRSMAIRSYCPVTEKHSYTPSMPAMAVPSGTTSAGVTVSTKTNAVITVRTVVGRDRPVVRRLLVGGVVALERLVGQRRPGVGPRRVLQDRTDRRVPVVGWAERRAVHAAADADGPALAGLVAECVGQRLDRVAVAHLEAVEVEERVQFDERELAVATEELLGGGAQVVAGDRMGRGRQRRQPAAAGLGRTAGPAVRHDGPQPVVHLERVGREGPAARQPHRGVVLELPQGGDDQEAPAFERLTLGLADARQPSGFAVGVGHPELPEGGRERPVTETVHDGTSDRSWPRRMSGAQGGGALSIGRAPKPYVGQHAGTV